MSEIVLALIGVVCGFLGMYVGFLYIEKKVKNEASDMILTIIDDLAPELPKLLAKEEFRQFVYSVGVLAGNGAKQGALSGMGGKGKFNFNALLGTVAEAVLPQVLPGIVGKVVGMVGGAATGDQQQQQQQGVTDKW